MAWIARPSRVVSREHPEPASGSGPGRGSVDASDVDPELARLPAPERELERWRRERAARDALDRVDPTSWDPQRHERRPEEDGDGEDKPPEPALPRWPRAALYVCAFALWAAIMTLVGEPWWEFEHGPLVSMITPVLAGRLVERLLLRRRPDWNRHEDADVVHERRRPELGERARPYWAREGAQVGDGHDAGAPGDEPPRAPAD